MRLALTDLFRARWTDQIHEEWIRNVIRKRPDLNRAQLDRTKNLMNSHVRNCLISGYEQLENVIELPDPNDRHVVAAAIHGAASLIITFNLSDFPEATLKQHHLSAMHPDDFVVDLIDLDMARVLEAVATHRAALKNPPVPVDKYLDTLTAQGLTQTVALIRKWKRII